MIEQVLRIGRHTVRVGEHDDTLEMTLRGDVAPDEASQVFDFMASRFAGRSYQLLSGDLSELGHVPSGSRRVVMRESVKVPPIRGMVFYRTSFTARVISELVARAYALATRADAPVHFAEDEAEARAWLATRREQLAAEAHRQR
ncbi:hypothetical protein [Sorangium sp. So ce1024]|uniref:hypothetical protein n=1 Tax=unclassified Sorangium TaxID=2621164 RepID=UPI003F0CFFB5